MSFNLHGRSLLTLADFTSPEIAHLLGLAADLKAAKASGTEVARLTGKEIALIFEKDSTRTRAGFEVAAFDQGAHVTYLGPTGTHMGRKESVRDTARVLGRLYDGIEFRGHDHHAVETLAEHAGVPVYNGLTQRFHPTQALADLLTMREVAGPDLKGVSVCFLGDVGNNVAVSLAIGAVRMGMDMRLCGPASLWPSTQIVTALEADARAAGGSILLTEDSSAGANGARFIYTDVWVSMGEDKSLWPDRIDRLRPYRVDREMLQRTGRDDVRFLHCLPAFHDAQTEIGAQLCRDHHLDGIEVSDEVFESENSIVFDQAENRMHAIKAVLVATLGG
ncbi:ornithine carbamoyltransferase [Jannaschia donghaensis]|uniref:Ornithine carbamoyltransferase n=1 Tax=Jannaschia donghaensis TaxID=420998 RepID=A0A0M6YKA9_9RHOB|nr:ornithine carbamoyltransferase [Jannaschia donghaensis]CTQ50344.1 Ornithine carbamoyltransferase [Jannaschia donghaensis]